MYATNARENNTHGSELTSGEVTSIFANSFFSDSMSRRDYFSDDRHKRLTMKFVMNLLGNSDLVAAPPLIMSTPLLESGED